MHQVKDIQVNTTVQFFESVLGMVLDLFGSRFAQLASARVTGHAVNWNRGGKTIRFQRPNMVIFILRFHTASVI
jgi:hypothetical protein